MKPIHWPELIGALIRSGMTQPQLAQEAGLSQSTISDLLTGRTKDTKTSSGLVLIRLANARCGYGIRLDDDEGGQSAGPSSAPAPGGPMPTGELASDPGVTRGAAHTGRHSSFG